MQSFVDLSARKRTIDKVITDCFEQVMYPDMIIKESDEVSASERYLIKKSKSTFLSLWSYHNLFTSQKKGKELCDVLAVFENHIFIFSDKLCSFNNDGDIRTAWNRWYRHAVEAGAKQILGAERYIKSKGSVFLDSKLTRPFPLPLVINENTHIHRIVVARGIKDACIRYFDGGNGSLVINTGIVGQQHKYDVDWDGTPIESDKEPIFSIGIVADRQHYFHVFDDYTLDCIMDELDTKLLMETHGKKQKCLPWNLKLSISAIQRKRLLSLGKAFLTNGCFRKRFSPRLKI